MKEKASKKRVIKKYTYGVYVIELNRDPLYVYVGQSCWLPEKRFEQHRAGYKAARIVKNASFAKLRPDLYDKFKRRTKRDQILELEKKLATLLKEKGYTVKGGH